MQRRLTQNGHRTTRRQQLLKKTYTLTHRLSNLREKRNQLEKLKLSFLRRKELSKK